MAKYALFDFPDEGAVEISWVVRKVNLKDPFVTYKVNWPNKGRIVSCPGRIISVSFGTNLGTQVFFSFDYVYIKYVHNYIHMVIFQISR